MSAPLAPSAGCCSPPCSDTPTANIPGPKGDPGTNGSNGHDGSNSFTTTTSNFTMPNVGNPVTVPVVSSAWAVPGEVLFVQFAGYFTCTSIPDSTHVTITNLGYTGNVAPASNVVSGAQVGPGGLQGPTGSAPSTTLNALSPTTTKGDIIVDNGANAPNANDVRLGVGTNGKVLVADSVQPTGLNYAAITPNTVTNLDNIPRFAATSGTPVAVKDSKLLITDDGSIQSTPTGGNARGSKATDLQVDRAVATQVASGANAGVLGGANNTASGLESTVAGGRGNVASGDDSGVASGVLNTASGTASFAGGGNANTASGTNSAVCAGFTNIATQTDAFVGAGANNSATAVGSAVVAGVGNTASGNYSAMLGGLNGKAYLYGQQAYASGSFGTQGSAQRSTILSRASTTDATPTNLTLDGGAALMVLNTNTVWGFRGQVVGRTSAGVCAMYSVSGAIKNNGGVTTLVGAVTVAAAVADGGWPGGASVTITADGVNNALQVQVVCAVATLCRWICNLELTEIVY